MEKLNLKSPAAQKLVLSLMLAGGILGVFFFTHFLPFGYPNQREHLTALRSEYEKKSTELARARATVSDLPRFEAEYENLHERWAQAAERLPTDRQLPALLRKITLAAQQTGVEFVAFRPSDERSEQHYTELPLQISVFGDYHKIGSFLAEIANMRRIVTVSNLALRANTKPDAGASTSAEFTASAYSLNANSAPPPAPAPAPAGKQGEGHAKKSS